ncbi:hypothetical protein M409DRAFT_63319 [Zasmidium cellare ATCC 36951]|uniref:Zn(2)-C6 fungal-type domain-containing protein n=1 Tax=Zasmidium cellare ATCC 36951 TaxID=1080233 RepID=A0A6A6D253_ZASCE|nr:uncharacterized protein M409DRAFT_63319 [Zasmidium cellare ATCC 36951]KAF2171706.1 hypothetical protein M409DRAFT_63319 [Zasmidium cellare ATCC 36951]
MDTSTCRVGKRPRAVNKSCLPCRARKVKCDANVIGLPCSSCTSRQCTEGFIHSHPSRQSSISDSQDDQSTRQQTERDLLYLNILGEAVKEPKRSSRRHPEEVLTPRNCLWTRLPQLDEVDNEYLLRKGVFDLPSQPCLDALIKTYFEYVHPFAPVINRVDFIRGYQSGDCSLLLLRTILTAASVHAPADVLSACGFASRSDAQESFFTTARLLHDFAVEDDLLMLQGSIILCMVILDHPTEWDFGYWLHNAIRLATRLDLRTVCIREIKSRKILKVYRRIWWALYSLDVFHVYVNTRRMRLLEDATGIKPRSDEDCETDDDDSNASPGLLSALTLQQKMAPIIQSDLCRTAGECLSTAINKPQQSPRNVLQPMDTWRKSLITRLHLDENAGNDLCYLHIQAMSYRFECIVCRLILRQRSRSADGKEWAKQRLRSAILELDTIAMRVLASGTLQDFPISFITTITALLALHIEFALDPAETDLVRSMSRISISQTMLVLTEGQEIPVLKRALPIFEEILTKKNLYVVGHAPPLPQQGQDAGVADQRVGELGDSGLQLGQGEMDSMLFDADFLGLDFLDGWSVGQVGFLGQY